MSQNYKRLGLASRLNDPTGGTEKSVTTIEEEKEKPSTNTLSLGSKAPATIVISDVRVERDPETGAILRVIDEYTKKPNPLSDPLNDLEDSDDESFTGFEHEHGVVPGTDAAPTGRTEVVRRLEEEASRPAPKRPRKQSDREEEWIGALIEKYGDDYGKMSRDMKMNPMQQSSGDLKKRVKKWRATHV